VIQLLSSILLIPLAAVPHLGKVPLNQLPEYLLNGAKCFASIATQLDDRCEAAPVATVVYLTLNVIFNISMLILLKRAGALLAFIANTTTFPLVLIVFALPWPLLGPSKLNYLAFISLAVELVGIVVFRCFDKDRLNKIQIHTAQDEDTKDAEKPLLIQDRPEADCAKPATS
jgi:hypothetical protein